MLWLIAAALVGFLLMSVGQVVVRRVRLAPLTTPAKRRTVPVAKAITLLLAGVTVLMLLRFGLQWLVVAGTAVLGLSRWLFPLLRFLPIGRAVARWATSHKEQRSTNVPRPADNAAAMTRSEALKILDLKEGATPEKIGEAYRNLMIKMHPDHGGSGYLASKINEARDVLL